jgi:hypothetical protein
MARTFNALHRAMRLFVVDDNPLRRPDDLWETLAVTLAVLVVLTTLPVAIALGLATGHANQATADRQAASRHEVSATVTGRTVSTGWAGWPVPVGTVTWSDRGGHPHQASTGLAPGERVGDRVTLWVDAAGHLTVAPSSPADVAMTGLAVAFGIESAAVGLALTGYWLIRRGVDRRRYRDWDAAWRRFNRIPH